MKVYKVIINPEAVSIKSGRLVVDANMREVLDLTLMDWDGETATDPDIPIDKRNKKRVRRHTIPGSSAHQEIFKMCMDHNGVMERSQIHEKFIAAGQPTSAINSGIARLVKAGLAKIHGGKGGDVHILSDIRERDFRPYMHRLNEKEKEEKKARKQL